MTAEDNVKQAIVDLKYDEIGGIIKNALEDGIDPMNLLDSLKKGLDIVGDLYHKKKYFLSELFMSGETMSAAMDVLMPSLSKEAQSEEEGTVLIGSIQGDVHDFGKNIAKTFLIASGFTVHDLGIDVPPAKFVDEALRLDVDVIGISAILTVTQPTSKEVVDELNARGLRNKFRVILGGTGVTDRCVKDYGVDAAVNDATEGVNIIKQWMREDITQ